MLAGPSDELGDLRVCFKQFECVVVSAEVFFFGLKFVYGVMAVATQRDRFLHLLTSKVLLEPFIAVASARDQMMFGGSLFRRSAAKQASGQWLVHCAGMYRCRSTKRMAER